MGTFHFISWEQLPGFSRAFNNPASLTGLLVDSWPVIPYLGKSAPDFEARLLGMLDSSSLFAVLVLSYCLGLAERFTCLIQQVKPHPSHGVGIRLTGIDCQTSNPMTACANGFQPPAP